VNGPARPTAFGAASHTVAGNPPARLPGLTAVLAALVSDTAASAVRVVDGRVGTVVAAVGGPASDADDATSVARLVREALACGAAASDDVVVGTRRSVHVLRRAPVVGVFLHLWLDRGRDIARARRALADPGLHEIVRRTVTGADPAGTPRQPALAAVGADRPHVQRGSGHRAAEVLVQLSHGRPVLPGPRDAAAARPNLR
jgi:hypothetical protein